MNNPNKILEENLTISDKIALVITGKIGTIYFFSVVVLWTTLWLLWNNFGPQKLRFDPAPDFLLWLFISNVIQLFLLPLLLIAQNLSGKHAEITADNDFLIDTKTHAEIELLHKKMDEILLLLNK